MMDTAILIGRYQPFHLGHYLMYKEARKHFKDVYIGLVERGTFTPDIKNPFSPDERERFIRQADSSLKICRVSTLYYEKVWEEVGEEVALIIGPDREPAIKNMGGAKDGTGKFEYYTIDERYGEYSATNVRKALEDADLVAFRKLVHKGNRKEFDFMVERYRDILLV